MLITTAAQADQNKRTVDVHGQPYVLREYIGKAPSRGIYVEGNEANDNALPQGFLVNQPPRSVTPPHFHEHDQFQVFVAGSAHLGKKTANPLTVQYAGAHTPYGPITAGDEGVQYFTLRKRWDPGAKYMPQMRELLIRGHQRQRVATIEKSKLEDQHEITLIPQEPDGLLACIIHLGAGEQRKLPDPAIGDGQYQVVLEGALIEDNESLPPLSCQFVFAKDGQPVAHAGESGLKMLVLRFPKPSEAIPG